MVEGTGLFGRRVPRMVIARMVRSESTSCAVPGGTDHPHDTAALARLFVRLTAARCLLRCRASRPRSFIRCGSIWTGSTLTLGLGAGGS